MNTQLRNGFAFGCGLAVALGISYLVFALCVVVYYAITR